VIKDQDVEVDRWLQKKWELTPSGHVVASKIPGSILLPKILDNLHLLGIRQPGVEDPARSPACSATRKSGAVPGSDTLGKDNDPPLALAVNRWNRGNESVP
jgi:hypothetical protein